MKILLIGGYGNVGKFLSELILSNTNSSIIIVGRDKAKAEKFKDELVVRHDEKRIETGFVDASNTGSLINEFMKSDFVINAASTIQFTNNIVEALLQTKNNYLDVLMSSPQKLNLLKATSEQFVKNDQCIISDGGFHPGLPAALIRYAADYFDEIHSANVGSLLNMDWKFEFSSPDTIKEFIYEFKEYGSTAYVKKEWRKLSYKDYKYFDFDKPFGKKPCISMMMEELKELPDEYPSLSETGFYISGFNWFTDYFVTPLMMFAVKRFSLNKLNSITKLFKWSLRKFSKPPYKVILQLIAEGIKEDKNQQMKIEVSHEDGYFLTAVPAFACLHQYLEKSNRIPGLHFQANYVEPKKFLNDIKRLGCEVKIEFNLK
ncbi:MAG: saccharopine dehydrogenase NADP-binding domain-containing protein [Melioribacteraceae bacterium]|nr:MAG: saccharopine dehydrogenase NADP-binding domain-containing protein [Melioribacteraceae bacterium]